MPKSALVAEQISASGFEITLISILNLQDAKNRKWGIISLIQSGKIKYHICYLYLAYMVFVVILKFLKEKE